MNPKEYSAAEATRILEELAPYFAELERRTMEDIVGTCSLFDENSDRKRRCLADKITVIRDVQAQLKSVIQIGAQSVRRTGVV